MLDAEVREGAADLRGMRAVDGPARLGGVKGPAGAVGVEGDGQPPGRADGMQGVEHRGRRLAGPELGVEQALGGVVQDRDERLALVRTAAEPGMGAAIEVQEFAEAGAGLPPAPMPAARPGLADQPGLLQGELDEAVGEGHGVIPAGEAVEVADVPAGEALAIEAQDALHLGRRRFAARGAQTAAVIEGERPPAS